MVGGTHVVDTVGADHILDIFQGIAQGSAKLGRTGLGLLQGDSHSGVEYHHAVIAVTGEGVATACAKSGFIALDEVQRHCLGGKTGAELFSNDQRTGGRNGPFDCLLAGLNEGQINGTVIVINRPLVATLGQRDVRCSTR